MLGALMQEGNVMLFTRLSSVGGEAEIGKGCQELNPIYGHGQSLGCIEEIIRKIFLKEMY